jgi:hypothetical protein
MIIICAGRAGYRFEGVRLCQELMIGVGGNIVSVGGKISLRVVGQQLVPPLKYAHFYHPVRARRETYLYPVHDPMGKFKVLLFGQSVWSIGGDDNGKIVIHSYSHRGSLGGVGGDRERKLVKHIYLKSQ